MTTVAAPTTAPVPIPDSFDWERLVRFQRSLYSPRYIEFVLSRRKSYENEYHGITTNLPQIANYDEAVKCAPGLANNWQRVNAYVRIATTKDDAWIENELRQSYAYLSHIGCLCNCEDSILRVRTPSTVVIQGVDFGPFEFRYNLNDLEARFGESLPGTIVDYLHSVALEPNEQDGYSHPHVYASGGTCIDIPGQWQIWTAMSTANHADWFLQLIAMIRTYNPASPYLRLEHWQEDQEEDGDYYTCGCGREYSASEWMRVRQMCGYCDDRYICNQCRLRGHEDVWGCNGCLNHICYECNVAYNSDDEGIECQKCNASYCGKCEGDDKANVHEYYTSDKRLVCYCDTCAAQISDLKPFLD